MTQSNLVTVTSNLLRYTPLYGALAATEALASVPIGANTAKKMFVRVTTWTLDGDAQVTLRKNGVDTALVKTITGVGTFEVTGDVSFSDGDLASIEIDTTGSGSGSVLLYALICFLSP